MTDIEIETLGNLVITRTFYSMELTVEELIEQLQEINDKHKKVFVETDMESMLTPVSGVEEKHYGVIIKC